MKRSKFFKFICIFLAIIAALKIIDTVVEFAFKKSAVYAEVELPESDDEDGFYVNVNNNKYVELPDNYLILKPYKEKPIAILKLGSYPPSVP